MDIYILQKDYLLVNNNTSRLIKAGSVFILNEGEVYAICDKECKAFHKDVVANNPEWFKLKEPLNYTESWEYKQQQKKLDEMFNDCRKIFLNEMYKIKKEGREQLNKIGITETQRPPLDIMPEYIWREQRAIELAEYFQRVHFKNCEKQIAEWNEHANWLMKRKSGE